MPDVVRAKLAEALRDHFKLHRPKQPEEWVCGGCYEDFHKVRFHEQHLADVLLSLEGVTIVALPEPTAAGNFPTQEVEDPLGSSARNAFPDPRQFALLRRLLMPEQPNGYLRIGGLDGMVWPDPRDPRELEWRLRYAPDSITRADQLALASIVHAYGYLVYLDARTRQKRVMQVREAVTDA